MTRDQLAAVRVPVPGVIGTGDRNLVTMRELTSVFGDLALVTVDGATHGGERGYSGPRGIPGGLNTIHLGQQNSAVRPDGKVGRMIRVATLC